MKWQLFTSSYEINTTRDFPSWNRWSRMHLNIWWLSRNWEMILLQKVFLINYKIDNIFNWYKLAILIRGPCRKAPVFPNAKIIFSSVSGYYQSSQFCNSRPPNLAAQNRDLLGQYLLPATVIVVSVTATTSQGEELSDDELKAISEAIDMALELTEVGIYPFFEFKS